MISNKRLIGFDREIQIEWLDATAAKVADGYSTREIRIWLDKFLESQVGGTKTGGNRSKTITVLSRIWSNIPKECRSIRNQALDLIQKVDTDERLAIHWAMATATYPFFGETTYTIGRLLTLQDDVRRQAVLRRLTNSWGDRPAVSRAGRAIWSSIASWNVMEETNIRGQYTQIEKRLSVSPATTELLIEACILTSQFESIPLTAMKSWPGLFPFALADVAASVRASKNIIVSHQGGNLEILQIEDLKNL